MEHTGEKIRKKEEKREQLKNHRHLSCHSLRSVADSIIFHAYLFYRFYFYRYVKKCLTFFPKLTFNHKLAKFKSIAFPIGIFLIRVCVDW